MYTIGSYITYLIISILITVWVARTLFKNGRAFLVEAFHENVELADSINHLLVVGFYLLNMGFVSLAMKIGNQPTNLLQSLEYLSHRVGVILLSLGLMHFLNLAVFTAIRKNGTAKNKKIETLASGKV